MTKKGFSIWDRRGGLSEPMRWLAGALLTLILLFFLAILFHQDSQKTSNRPAMVISLPNDK